MAMCYLDIVVRRNVSSVEIHALPPFQPSVYIPNTKYQYFIPIKVPQGAMTNIHL